MLTLRKEQVKVFGPLGIKSFEDRVGAHVRKVFPDKAEALGEPKLREAIRYGAQRARSYSIISERDVCKYIDLAILYGPDFDKDRNLPWAQSILEKQNHSQPHRKSRAALSRSQKAQRQNRSERKF